VLTAMVSLVGATVWLALHPSWLLDFYYSFRMLALTHVLTLGFATALTMGVLLRLAPMALAVEPRSLKLALAQFALFFIGASGMVVHFVLEEWFAVGWAALLVLAAAVMQLVNMSGLFAKARDGDPVALHACAALIHLVLTALLGSLFGLHNGYGLGATLLTAPLLSKLSAHLHLALGGWISNMIVGVQLKMVPTTGSSPRRLLIRFALMQIGLLGLVSSLLLGLDLEMPFALMLATALTLHAAGPLRAFGRRSEWRWEATSLAVLVVLAVVGLLLAAGIPDPTSQLRQRVQLAYAYVALYGWVIGTVTAVAFKLFPMWVWQERFADRPGPRPAVVELYSDRLRTVTGTGLNLGSLVTAAGIVTSELIVIRIGLVVVLIGVAAFAANFIRTARWALFDLEWKEPGRS